MLPKFQGDLRMKDFQESTYGDRIAEVYDDLHGGLASPEVVDPMVDVLADLAGCGKALELGIGTGRIALPLAARGLRSTASMPRRPWSRRCTGSREATAYPSRWATSRTWK